MKAVGFDRRIFLQGTLISMLQSNIFIIVTREVQTAQSQLKKTFQVKWVLCKWLVFVNTVGPRLSEPSIIRTVRPTVLLEYFDLKSMLY